MAEKPEWEIVDEAASQQQSHYGQRPQPLKLTELLKAALGRWWAWKLAGAALAFGVLLVLFAMAAGVFVVLAVAAALLSAGIAKVRQWRRSGRSPY